MGNSQFNFEMWIEDGAQTFSNELPQVIASS